MSAANYFVVRVHPNGGFTYVQGFASDSADGEIDFASEVDPSSPVFASLGEAVRAAREAVSEYGVYEHPEIAQSAPCVNCGKAPCACVPAPCCGQPWGPIDFKRGYCGWCGAERNRTTATTLCVSCETELEPVWGAREDGDYQYSGALWVGLFGGYGMYVDNVDTQFDSASRVLQGRPDYEAVLCEQCADEFVANNPWVAKLIYTSDSFQRTPEGAPSTSHAAGNVSTQDAVVPLNDVLAPLLAWARGSQYTDEQLRKWAVFNQAPNGEDGWDAARVIHDIESVTGVEFTRTPGNPHETDVMGTMRQVADAYTEMFTAAKYTDNAFAVVRHLQSSTPIAWRFGVPPGIAVKAQWDLWDSKLVTIVVAQTEDGAVAELDLTPVDSDVMRQWSKKHRNGAVFSVLAMHREAWNASGPHHYDIDRPSGTETELAKTVQKTLDLLAQRAHVYRRLGVTPGEFAAKLRSNEPLTDKELAAQLELEEISYLLGDGDEADPEERASIAVDPAVLSGTPCLSGTRIPVYLIVDVAWNEGIAPAMEMWNLTREQVLVACWFAGAYGTVELQEHPNDDTDSHEEWARVYRAEPVDTVWLERWREWAHTYSGDLWHMDYDNVPDPPERTAGRRPTNP